MKRYTLFAAAALAVGGMTFVGCDRDDTASNTTSSGQTAGQKTDNAIDRAGDAVGKAVDKTAEAGRDAGEALSNAAGRAGDKIADATDSATDNAQEAAARIGDKGTAAAPDAEGIRDVMASVTEAALTENGLDDLVERLVDADRNAIGNAIEADAPDHAALVKQFRADWKAKYGKDFDIKNEEAALPASMFKVTQGEIGDAAPSATEVATGQRAGDVDANQERGRNIANVAIAASHGMPGLTVPLIHEAPDAWKIDAPTMTADKLRSNVLAHLKAAHDMKAQWPADVNDAYAAVTHHVLMAVLDQPLK